MIRILLSLIILTIALNGTAQQKALVLIKKNSVIARFTEGEKIRFQFKGDKEFASATITGIHKDFIKVNNEDTIYVSEIGVIDMRHHSNNSFHTASSGRKLIAAGVILLFTDMLNSSDSNTISSGVWITSGILAGGGTVMQFFNNNYFKVGRKKKVTIGSI
ncbi:MAG: hypothetical protein HOP08_13475 [Cyclobacteriaceae bacterium]|nr:hypothetical protein [Cyclobacteriaceae bacterium]